MRVLHLSSGSLFGGVETFLIELARRGGEGASMQPHYALTEEGRLSGELQALGAPVHLLGRVRMRNPLQVKRVRQVLLDQLRMGNFDAAICHSPWAHALFAPVVRSASVPLVFHLHGHVTGTHWLERLARRTPPDLVLTNSHFTAETSENLFQGVPCEMIRYPVPAPAPTEAEGNRRSLREELGTPQDDVVIVQTSRMEPWKGHRLHLDALLTLKDLPGWTSWLVGGAQRRNEITYQQELLQTAARYGIAERVRFVGQRSDVPAILRASDIHCQPNLGPEPFGIAFVEALYRGLPVVTTELGGPREIVSPESGILTPPGDAAALGAALRQLILDPEKRRRLGSAGPARAAELCDPQRQVERFASVLGGLRRNAPTNSSLSA